MPVRRKLAMLGSEKKSMWPMQWFLSSLRAAAHVEGQTWGAEPRFMGARQNQRKHVGTDGE